MAFLRSLSAAAIAGVLCAGVVHAAPVDQPQSGEAAGRARKASPHAWLTEHPTIQRLVALTNQQRARYGLPALVIDPQLCLLAQQHATWMAQTGYYQHSNYGISEIIFQGPRTPEAAVQGWIASPAHHGIMLSGSRVGFGYMVLGGRTYWVGLFQ